MFQHRSVRKVLALVLSALMLWSAALPSSALATGENAAGDPPVLSDDAAFQAALPGEGELPADTAAAAEDEPSAVSGPAVEPEPAAEAEQVTESEPAAEDEPSAASEPAVETEPAAEAEQVTESEPAAEDEPSAASEPAVETEPAAEAEQVTESEPAAEDEPSAASEPAVETEPAAEAEQVTESEPAAEDEPSAASEPATEDKPAVETEPATETESAELEPAAEDESAAETAPAAEPEPEVEPEPAEDEPVAETELAGDIGQETLTEPVAETDPASDTEPAAEAGPTAEDEPAAETEPAGDIGQETATEPVAETDPASDTEPAAETEPTAETEPATEAGPTAEDEPAPETEPAGDIGQETATELVAENDPATGTEPAVEPALPLSPEEDELVWVFEEEMADVLADADTDDPDALLNAYIEIVLKQAMIHPELLDTPILRSISVDDGRLSDTCLQLYRQLKPSIDAIAAGKQSSTELSVSYDDLGLQTRFTATELGLTVSSRDDLVTGRDMIGDLLKVDYALVQLALLANCPYELYWYDKTQGARTTSVPKMSVKYQNGDYVYEITSPYSVRMAVSADYSADTYQVDTSVGQTVQASVQTAQDIVARYQDLNDLEKLNAYRDEICAKVTYNSAAAGGGAPYGDPWQLIYVFDDDADTNVVCEGYAKAFQYLCDMSAFDGDVNCYTVTGQMNGGTGAGAHMWNIVTMSNGLNYLVDVTNSDSGTVGSDGSLFLNGYDQKENHGFIFRNTSDQTISYLYSENAETLYTPAELDLSGKMYEVTCHLDLYPRHTLNHQAMVAPTCTEAGRAACWVCAQDGGIFADEKGAVSLSESDLVLPATGHEWGEWTAVTPATCTEDGVETRVCLHDEMHTETRTAPMLGHDWSDWTVTIPATCTEYGLETRVCLHDKTHTGTRTLPMLGHEWGEWAVTTPATCTEDGIETRVCLHDEAHTETRPVPMLGHEWGEWTVTTPATCTEEGEETRVCLHDEAHTETRPVPMLGHEWGEWTVTTPATCTEDGIETRVCLHDETHTEIRPVPMLGHEWGEWTVTTPATCTEEGEETRVCLHDEAHTETRPVPMLGHEWGEWTVTTPATCTEEGEETRVCLHDETHIETRPTEKAPHQLLWVAAQAPDYEADGWIGHWTCEACGQLFADEAAQQPLTEAETLLPRLPRPEWSEILSQWDGWQIARAEEALTSAEWTAWCALSLREQLAVLLTVLNRGTMDAALPGAALAGQIAARTAQAPSDRAAMDAIWPRVAVAGRSTPVYRVTLTRASERVTLLVTLDAQGSLFARVER